MAPLHTHQARIHPLAAATTCCAVTERARSYDNTLGHCTESTGYFVLEHQPQTCGEFPPNGKVTWTDIEVRPCPSPTPRPQVARGAAAPKR